MTATENDPDKADALARARAHLRSTLTPEMGFYRAADPHQAARDYASNLKQAGSVLPASQRQRDAVNQLAFLMGQGAGLGLPTLVWSIGSGRNISGTLIGAALPDGYTEQDCERAFLAWCAVIGADAHKDNDGHWSSSRITLAPDVEVVLFYAFGFVAEPCPACQRGGW